MPISSATSTLLAALRVALLLCPLAHAQAAPAASTSTSASASAAPIAVPSTGAHGPLSRQFSGFAFDFVELNDTLGEAGTPNSFSINLIRSVANITSSRPFLRAGGTTGDVNAHYVPSGPGGNGAYPPRFFGAFQNVPDAEFIAQVPFRPGNVSNSVEFFRAELGGIMKGVGTGLYAVEIGNEENTFVADDESGYRRYVNQFREFESGIVQTGLLENLTAFQAIDSAWGKGYAQLTPAQVFPLGLNNNSGIKSVAWHYYQIAGAVTDLQSQLMNHTAIANGLDPYRGDIQYMRSNYPGIALFFDEVGNSLGSAQDNKLASSMGAALWAIDFQLYCMVLDIDRVEMQNRAISPYTPWIGYGSNAAVQGPFYASPYVATFVGNSSAATTVNIISNTTLYPAYAAYDGGRLSRLALLNLDYWSSNASTTARPTHTFTLSVPSAVKTGHVSQLSSPDGATGQAPSMAFAGTQWSLASNGRPVPNQRSDSFDVQASAGVLRVPVPASEAVIVNV